VNESRLNILLVLDDPSAQRLKEYLIEHEKLFEVMTARSAEDAFVYFLENSVSIAILDYELLGDKRIEVLRQADKTPCIFISNLNNIPTAVDMIKAGAIDFIVKDSQFEYLGLLSAAIKKATGQKSIKNQTVFRRQTTELKKANHKLLEKLGELALTQKALRESNLFSQEIINGAGDGIIVYDRYLCYVIWNPFIEKITGIPASEVLGKKASDLFPQLSEQGIDEMLKRTLAGETNVTAEFEYRIAQTNRRGWLAATYVPHHDSNGNIVGIIATMRDITERKKVEVELRNNELNYRDLYIAAQRQTQEMELLDRIRTAVASELDLKTLFRIVVEEIAKAFGYPLISIYMREGDDLLLQYQIGYDSVFGKIPISKGITGRVTRTGQSVFLEDVSRDPEFLEAIGGIGSEICVPLFDQGQTVGVLNIEGNQEKHLTQADFQLVLTLSEQVNIAIGRARLYTQVRESERRISTLISNLPGIVYRCKNDQNWTMEFISAGCIELTGYSPADFMENRKVNFNDLIVEEDREKIHNSIQNMININESFELTYRIRTADKELKWLWEKGQGVFSKTGEFIALEGFITDITERLQHERELGTLASVSAALRAAQTHNEMLPIILDQTVKVLNADTATLELIDPVNGDAVIQMAFGSLRPLTDYRIPYDKGLNSYIRSTGKPYLNNDVIHDPKILDPSRYGEIKANAGAPMIAEGKLLGFLWIGRRTVILESEIRPLVAIADIAANAIHRSMLHEQTKKRLEQLTALRKVDIVISSSPDLRAIFDTILEQVAEQLKADAAAILLLDADLFNLELAARRGFRTNFVEYRSFYLGESLAGKAVLGQKVIRIADLTNATEAPAHLLKALADEDFVSYYAVPLIAKGQVKGVLEVYFRSRFIPDLEWLNFFEAFGGQTAIAIDNVELFRGIQRSNIELALAYDATIEGWSKALDLRDKETEGHTRRVTEITLNLARTMGISEGEQIHIRRGALLHDIGKMGVPDSILLKPGPLSDEEWVVMRKHPQYAYEMLAPIRYLHSALDIPYCHHEKWDGSGYPRGLKNEQIPLSARIFAVVDVWDAITSDRPYRLAWSKEKAVDYIRSEAGKQFDPHIVDVFLQMAASSQLQS
jgi:PAS domain S-box-containing protein